MTRNKIEKKIQTNKLRYDPLRWWKDNQTYFPTISRLTEKILGVTATSASIERLLSKTGFILRQHTWQMTNTLAENLFFLKENETLLSKLYNLD
ncbi:zinc finger BED domain-containing 1-like [Brachionus plicatilis]|uniref:Zinc finger BED domain-containing 1-like n=1 Tax=Brachionus plicatilis TaxID=10195 RepID=A0A3M7QWC5_BRAPC|nr:zinc finger BED domain-containing 1-like [Brachionus plicatilis]